MAPVDRRSFLGLLGGAAAASVSGKTLAQTAGHAPPQDFDFIFFTDTHLQPELDAAKGCDMAFKKMRGLKVDFAIQGGDHVFDALAVPKSRSIGLFDLYDKTQQDLSVKVYHTIGNHDCLGINPLSGVQPTDPLYGKKFYQDHIAKTYYSFDHKGVHFIVMDSIGLTPDRSYEGHIDETQVAWLEQELAARPAGPPTVVVTHIPLATSIGQYAPPPAQAPVHNGMTVGNAPEVIKLFAGRNVIAVLQGHTHINERVEWQGVPYITSGAVCGNWWKGTRLGVPEGYTVVSFRGGKLTTRYETYGFQTVDPQNT